VERSGNRKGVAEAKAGPSRVWRGDRTVGGGQEAVQESRAGVKRVGLGTGRLSRRGRLGSCRQPH
jgi:hypothetical protein